MAAEAYKVKLINKKEIAENTLMFELEKPAAFTFKAGQSLVLSLPDVDPGDWKNKSRSFSIASAPYEENIILASRIGQSDFKQKLTSIALGRELKIRGPGGQFVLPEDYSKPIVFLAGGIGITPVRSMVLQALHENLLHKIFLFYSNRRPEDSPFFQTLSGIKNKNYNFIPTMTNIEKSSMPWQGEKGYIGREMLKKYIGNLKIPLFYIVGPSPFVEAMNLALSEEGIDRENIKIDNFGPFAFF